MTTESRFTEKVTETREAIGDTPAETVEILTRYIESGAEQVSVQRDERSDPDFEGGPTDEDGWRPFWRISGTFSRWERVTEEPQK